MAPKNVNKSSEGLPNKTVTPDQLQGTNFAQLSENLPSKASIQAQLKGILSKPKYESLQKTPQEQSK